MSVPLVNRFSGYDNKKDRANKKLNFVSSAVDISVLAVCFVQINLQKKKENTFQLPLRRGLLFITITILYLMIFCRLLLNKVNQNLQARDCLKG